MVIITIFHIFEYIEERLSMLSGDIKNILKDPT